METPERIFGKVANVYLTLWCAFLCKPLTLFFCKPGSGKIIKQTNKLMTGSNTSQIRFISVFSARLRITVQFHFIAISESERH